MPALSLEQRLKYVTSIRATSMGNSGGEMMQTSGFLPPPYCVPNASTVRDVRPKRPDQAIPNYDSVVPYRRLAWRRGRLYSVH